MDPQLGQFSPPEAALDVGLHQQPGIRVRQCLVQEIEFGGGHGAWGNRWLPVITDPRRGHRLR